MQKIYWGLIIPLIINCAQSKLPPSHSVYPVAIPERSNSVKQLWSHRAGGKITDITLSRNGKYILVATAPDAEIEGNLKKLFLSKYQSNGKLIWRIPVKATVKEQDLSEDGLYAVVSNYENQVQGIDQSGKVSWTYDTACKPKILNALKKVICFHDDDPGPGVVFDVLNWKGQKENSFSASHDILAMKVSDDEKNIAIALTNGKILLFQPMSQPNFKPMWEKTVNGEVVDVSVSSDEPKVTVLYWGSGKKRTISVFDKQGTLVKTSVPSFPSLQLELIPSGDLLFVYGNSQNGQYLGGFSIPDLQEKWKFLEQMPSDYTASITVTSDQVILGYEDVTPSTRHNHLLGFDFSGKLVWNLPVLGEEGTYLYHQQFSEDNRLLVVGTDDGKIGGYRVEAVD